MTKSKIDIVTTSTIYLDIVMSSVIVVEIIFSLLALGGYLLPLNILNTYPDIVAKNFISTTSSENTTITRHAVFLVTW